MHRVPDLDYVSALGQEGKVQVPHLCCGCAALASSIRDGDGTRHSKKKAYLSALAVMLPIGCQGACALLAWLLGMFLSTWAGATGNTIRGNVLHLLFETSARYNHERRTSL